MKPSVKDNWLALNAPLEGRCPWMYSDIRGLVTCAVGILIDPPQEALKIPWKRKDGSAASQADILAEFWRVKNTPGARKLGVKYWETSAQLHLTPEDMESVILDKLTRFDQVLNERIKNWNQFPADAQFATLSLSWAMGPYFVYPHWEAAALANRWDICAEECYIPDGFPGGVADGSPQNRGLVPRNRMNREMFLLALVSNPAMVEWRKS